MKTIFETKEAAEKNRKWFLVDAEGEIVGRLATKISNVLRGKNNPRYTPHTDTGDFVVVVNADKVSFSGLKAENKTYYRHTGYVGGIKKETAAHLLERRPEEVLKRAVKGMLPKGALGRDQLNKLKVYAGPEHPHQAQQPQVLG